MTDEAKKRGRWQGHAWILAGRKPALAAAQGHGPRRLCLHRRTRRFSVPPSGAHAGAGVGNGKKSCAFHFFNRGNRSKKKSHLKRPRDPLRSQLPTSGLSRAAAAAFTHARSSQHPAPHFRVPAAAAAAASLPGKPPSFLRVAGEGAAPRACSEHVPAAVPARPRCRWPARKQAVLASRGKQAARPGNPREGVLLLRPPVPDVVRLGLRASLTRGVRFLRDLSPTRLLIAGLGLPTGWGADVT